MRQHGVFVMHEKRRTPACQRGLSKRIPRYEFRIPISKILTTGYLLPKSMTPRTSSLLVQLACSVVLLAVAQFVVIQGVAMTQYPGGHGWDFTAPGYHFWWNTLCDLGKTVAFNGQLNPMAVWSRASAAGFMLSLGLLWLVLPGLFPDCPRIGLWMRVFGILSLGGMVGLGFTPVDEYPVAHAAANGFAAVPGLTAAVLTCVGIARSKQAPRFLLVLGVVFLIVGFIHFGQYVGHFWLGFAWTPAAPAVQRIAFLLGLLWIVLACGVLLRRAKLR